MYGPEDCHGLQLTYWHYIRLTKAVTWWVLPCSTFWCVNKITIMIKCCLVQVWAADTKSSRYHPQDRFNRKELHVPPRNVGITADYVQYIIHAGLCRVYWLLVWVWVTEWAVVTGCKIWVSDPSTDMRFFSSLQCPDRLWDHPTSYSKGMWIIPWG